MKNLDIFVREVCKRKGLPLDEKKILWLPKPVYILDFSQESIDGRNHALLISCDENTIYEHDGMFQRIFIMDLKSDKRLSIELTNLPDRNYEKFAGGNLGDYIKKEYIIRHYIVFVSFYKVEKDGEILATTYAIANFHQLRSHYVVDVNAAKICSEDMFQRAKNKVLNLMMIKKI